MGQQSIDSLATKRSLIDLEGHSNGDFGLDNDFLLSFIFDDIILATKRSLIDLEGHSNGDLD